MDNRQSAGIRKSFLIDLSEARTGKRYGVQGKYIRIADASDTVAKIEIAIGDDNVPSQYETLKKNGRIIEGNGFKSFYVKNTAQADKWVRVIVSDGADDYDVDNPSIGTIDSIGSIDEPVELNAAALAAINAITSMLQSDKAQRKPLTTLEGAAFASVANATTEIVSAAENTNGIIVRHAIIVSNGGGGSITADGDSFLRVLGTGTGVNHSMDIQNLFIPPGQALAAVSTSTSCYCEVFYEVLA